MATISARFPTDFYVQCLYVDANHRRQGIARQLLKNIEVAARDNNFTKMKLLAYCEQGAISGLYKSEGYKHHGQTPDKELQKDIWITKEERKK